MDDMISRQAAIKAFKDSLTIHDSRGAEYLCSAVTMDGVNRILSDLPSVQPEHLVKESGNLVNGLVNDCISRKAAIEALQNHYEVRNPKQNAIMDECVMLISNVPSAQPERMTNRQWVDFLSAQFDISRTSAKEMLHGMMRWKKEDNFKKLFNGGKT